MVNKILAIRGHNLRGKEVIEILEMLGGNNRDRFNGRSSGFYYIDCNDNIDFVIQSRLEFMTFYLEDFLEKFPFKVGDKVKYNGLIHYYRQKKFLTISSMDYINNTMAYKIDLGIWVKAENLQPYEEEIKAEDCLKYTLTPAADDSKIDITIDGEKLIAPKGYTIGNAARNDNRLIVEYIKNKPQYPKTYEECYAILNQNLDEHSVIGYRSTDVYNLQLLLICRDAYWKIAGEEMGLSEPWEPDFSENFIYAIGASYGTIQKIMVSGGRGILLFPTEEMRDAFFENFKDVIEACKDYL
jgi:hypothetical protein